MVVCNTCTCIGRRSENDHNHDGFLDEPLTTRYIFMNRWAGHLNPYLTTQFGVKVLDEERTGGQAASTATVPTQSRIHMA